VYRTDFFLLFTAVFLFFCSSFLEIEFFGANSFSFSLFNENNPIIFSEIDIGLLARNNGLLFSDFISGLNYVKEKVRRKKKKRDLLIRMEKLLFVTSLPSIFPIFLFS